MAHKQAACGDLFCHHGPLFWVSSRPLGMYAGSASFTICGLTRVYDLFWYMYSSLCTHVVIALRICLYLCLNLYAAAFMDRKQLERPTINEHCGLQGAATCYVSCFWSTSALHWKTTSGRFPYTDSNLKQIRWRQPSASFLLMVRSLIFVGYFIAEYINELKSLLIKQIIINKNHRALAFFETC